MINKTFCFRVEKDQYLMFFDNSSILNFLVLYELGLGTSQDFLDRVESSHDAKINPRVESSHESSQIFNIESICLTQ